MLWCHILALAVRTPFFETSRWENSPLSAIRVSVTPGIVPGHRAGAPWNISKAQHKRTTSQKVIHNFRVKFLFAVHGIIVQEWWMHSHSLECIFTILVLRSGQNEKNPLFFMFSDVTLRVFGVRSSYSRWSKPRAYVLWKIYFFWKNIFFQNRKIFFRPGKNLQAGISYYKWELIYNRKSGLGRFFFGRKNIFDFEKNVFRDFYFIFHGTHALGLLHLESGLPTPKTRKVTSEKPKKYVFFSPEKSFSGGFYFWGFSGRPIGRHRGIVTKPTRSIFPTTGTRYKNHQNRFPNRGNPLQWS